MRTRPHLRGTLISLMCCVSLLLAVAGAAAADAAGTGALELTVSDQVTGEVVPFANVLLVEPAGGYLAGDDGVCRVPLESGPYRLRVVHVSYQDSEEISLTIAPAETTRVIVALTPQDVVLEAVEVHASPMESVREATTQARRVNPEDVETLPNPRDDVFQMVRILPPSIRFIL